MENIKIFCTSVKKVGYFDNFFPTIQMVGLGDNVFPDSWLILDGFYIGIFWISIKAIFLIFVMMWFRWTFPRLRVDQLMYVCWKVFIPFSLANLFFVTIWELIAGAIS